MFDESLIESKGTHEGKKKWLTVPVSIAIHSFIVLLLVLGSYWFITEAVQPPPISVSIMTPPPPPPPPPPAKKKATPQPQQPQEAPKEMVQPTIVPQELPPPEEVPDGGGADGGVDGGVEGGVEGGVPGGVVGGVLGGVLSDGLMGQQQLQEETPMIVTAEMKPPVLVKKVEPSYPDIARKARMEGTVIIQAIIGRTGQVEDATVLRGVNPLLDQAALEAVRLWIYEPAMLNNKPVKVYFTVTVIFTLK